MKTSAAGIALIKRFEGFSAKQYLCPAGKLTIGYGHLIEPTEVYPAAGISEEAAALLLMDDVREAEGSVNDYVHTALKQHQFDALVDFVYNLGGSAFHHSTLLTLINENKMTEAAAQFGRWVYASGRKLPGLVARRQAEKELFES